MGPACVGLATCREVPDLDPDDRLLADALVARGVDVAPVVWTEPVDDPASFDLVVLRSTWDYHGRVDDFLAWTKRFPRLLNAPSVVRWNTDKTYLRELVARGLPIVPTVWVAPGSPVSRPTQEVVVKPAISAGSRDTARYPVELAEDAVAHARSLQRAGRTVMIQPYMPAVDTVGETAVLFFDGHRSHAIRKGPLLLPGAAPVEGLYAEETIEARTPSQAEVDLAEAVMDALPFSRDELLYARVDLVPDQHGDPLVLEVELTEPSLFLARAPGVADRLAEAIVARLPRPSR